MTIRRYQHGSPEYSAALDLRSKVLRGPLGLTYSDADLARESDDIHVGAFDECEIVGTLILTPSDKTVKMRQVAVAPERQGQGIGRQLVEFSEILARGLGFTEMTLHARETAVPFYEGLEYEVQVETFTEVTIPHRAMRKAL